MSTPRRYLSPARAAAHCGVSVRAVTKAIERGQLVPAVAIEQPGGRVAYGLRRTDLDRWRKKS
jgi:hypothetical protein